MYHTPLAVGMRDCCIGLYQPLMCFCSGWVGEVQACFALFVRLRCKSRFSLGCYDGDRSRCRCPLPFDGAESGWSELGLRDQSPLGNARPRDGRLERAEAHANPITLAALTATRAALSYHVMAIVECWRLLHERYDSQSGGHAADHLASSSLPAGYGSFRHSVTRLGAAHRMSVAAGHLARGCWHATAAQWHWQGKCQT